MIRDSGARFARLQRVAFQDEQRRHDLRGARDGDRFPDVVCHHGTHPLQRQRRLPFARQRKRLARLVDRQLHWERRR
ncbi:MAG: hypothetical protein U5Q44_14790 [Dehalococcoidia bacterium]|nr:hypothetical protein [Dehalococcoidia bacterium]